ncbi:MAG: copper chaperone PCu(A)C [Candidatus Elarobacter sp.]
MNRTIVTTVACLGLSLAWTAAAGPPFAANAWSRPAIDTGVVYVTLINNSSRADELVAAKTPLAHHVEFHESTSTSGPMGRMASMHRVRYIAVPAHGRAVLRPGGYHIMLIGLKSSLRAGTTFPLQLDFEHAGWTTTRVAVRATG